MRADHLGHVGVCVLLDVLRQVEDQKEDITTLQERQRDLFETIKSLEKDIQVRKTHPWISVTPHGLDIYTTTTTKLN